jgi:hypothetical protein
MADRVTEIQEGPDSYMITYDEEDGSFVAVNSTTRDGREGRAKTALGALGELRAMEHGIHPGGFHV